jgi:transposase-like protein
MELVRKADEPEAGADTDFLREGVRLLAQALMEAEVTQVAGAERGQRSAERTAQRNGYRSRGWDTRAGSIELAVPKLRSGSYFPSILTARKRAEKALSQVVSGAAWGGDVALI